MSKSLDHLFDRNAGWAQAKTRDDPGFFQRMAEQQTPNYLWIGCSDSRVTANDVLGLDPGEVFVHRNIANIVDTSDLNILSVLEYAVDHLQVRDVIVCGHYGCGGVQRAMVSQRGAMLDHWLQPLAMMLYRKHRPVFDALPDENSRLDRLCEINIEMQVRRLAATPIVENAWARGQKLNLHGWIYAIHDGLIRDLGPHLSSAGRTRCAPVDRSAGCWSRSSRKSARRRQAADAFASLDLSDMTSPPCCMPPLEFSLSLPKEG